MVAEFPWLLGLVVLMGLLALLALCDSTRVRRRLARHLLQPLHTAAAPGLAAADPAEQLRRDLVAVGPGMSAEQWQAHLDSWDCCLWLVEQQAGIFELWTAHLELFAARHPMTILPGGLLSRPAAGLPLTELTGLVHRAFVTTQYPRVLVPHILPACHMLARYYVEQKVEPQYRPYFNLELCQRPS